MNIMAARKSVILCVDDEETPLELRKLVLQKAGYEVLTASSARDALEVAGKHAIDLVLSDVLMPGTTGVELARELKTRFPELRVVLYSGVNEIPPGAEAADIFLSKIEGPDSLCQHVAAVLNGGHE